MFTRLTASPPVPAPGAAPDLTRRRLLRNATAAAGALLAAGPLSGCASPAAADARALSVWDLFQGGDGMLMDDMIKAVSKGPQGFEVERTILDWGPSYYTKLAMSAAGGRASDVAIMHLSRLAGYAPGGLLDPFDLDLLAEFGVSRKDFASAVWARTQHDGTVYAIPLDVHPFIVFYDKDAADQAGLLDASGELAPMGSPEALLDAGTALAKATGQKGILFGHVTDTGDAGRAVVARRQDHRMRRAVHHRPAIRRRARHHRRQRVLHRTAGHDRRLHTEPRRRAHALRDRGSVPDA